MMQHKCHHSDVMARSGRYGSRSLPPSVMLRIRSERRRALHEKSIDDTQCLA